MVKLNFDVDFEDIFEIRKARKLCVEQRKITRPEPSSMDFFYRPASKIDPQDFIKPRAKDDVHKRILKKLNQLKARNKKKIQPAVIVKVENEKITKAVKVIKAEKEKKVTAENENVKFKKL